MKRYHGAHCRTMSFLTTAVQYNAFAVGYVQRDDERSQRKGGRARPGDDDHRAASWRRDRLAHRRAPPDVEAAADLHGHRHERRAGACLAAAAAGALAPSYYVPGPRAGIEAIVRVAPSSRAASYCHSNRRALCNNEQEAIAVQQYRIYLSNLRMVDGPGRAHDARRCPARLMRPERRRRHGVRRRARRRQTWRWPVGSPPKDGVHEHQEGPCARGLRVRYKGGSRRAGRAGGKSVGEGVKERSRA